ncbi:MAG: DUF354 domain-containing protein, partial [Candidatus Hodarchaeota archaeon]
LERLGHEVALTARDCFQTCGLLDLAELKYKKIGKHFGKKAICKIAGLLIRTLQLYAFARGKGFSVAVNHGSPSQTLSAFLLRIPCVGMTDYEHQSDLYFMLSKMLVPEVIPDDVLRTKKVTTDKLVKYRGIKEEVYAGDFEADPAILDDLNIEPTKVIISIRPPATEAHYHNPESEYLLSAVIASLCKKRNVVMVVLPRTEKQRQAILKLAGQDSEKIIMPKKVLHGLNLIWHSDLVISGGGSMNREAAALGVPAYSIFAGEIGAVDRYLERRGRLHLISSPDDIKRIRIEKRTHEQPTWTNGNLIPFLINEILSTAR